MIQAGPPHNRPSETECGVAHPLRGGLAAVAVFLCLGLLAGCSGGGGGSDGSGGAGTDTDFQDSSNVADDRYVDGDSDPDGTGSVPHVIIIRELPGGDPSRDQVTDVPDLGG